MYLFNNMYYFETGCRNLNIMLLFFRYTYGKPVEGILRLNTSLETFAWGDEKFPTIEYEGKVK